MSILRLSISCVCSTSGLCPGCSHLGYLSQGCQPGPVCSGRSIFQTALEPRNAKSLTPDPGNSPHSPLGDLAACDCLASRATPDILRSVRQSSIAWKAHAAMSHGRFNVPQELQCPFYPPFIMFLSSSARSKSWQPTSSTQTYYRECRWQCGSPNLRSLSTQNKPNGPTCHFRLTRDNTFQMVCLGCDETLKSKTYFFDLSRLRTHTG